MKIRIHNGSCSDSVDIEGTLEECRKEASAQAKKRCWNNPWSEVIEK